MRKKAPSSKYKAFLGCDPGAQGGMSLIIPQAGDDIYDFFPWPKDDLPALYRQLRKWSAENDRKIFCHLERVWSGSGQGVKSVFSFGTNFGCWKMLLVCLNIDHHLPTPQEWQKAVGIVPEDGPDPKSRSYNVASRKFPEVSFITPRGRIMDEKTDSILIAESARIAGG